jgi:glycosyltransferase involved in cell wall biosynthesis
MIPLKVLHVNDVSNVASNLAIGQRAMGLKVDIFPVSKGRYKQNGPAWALLPLKKLRDAYRLKKFVREHNYQVIHVHFASHAWMAQIAHIPYYLHIHGSDVRRYLYKPVLRELTISAIKKAIRVFYVTPELKYHLHSLRPDAIFLPNPIDMDKFKANKKDVFPPGQVLCISKLDRYKGIEHFLRAIELLWSVRPGVTVGMFNFGNMVELARPFLTQYNNDPHLTLIPRIPYDQMAALNGAYEVVLGHQDPEYGSLSCSELEAMACKKSVVVHFLYPEAYPEPPPVLISKSPEEACFNIIQLLDNPEQARFLGVAARDWIGQYHERDLITKRLLEYYQETN